MKNWNTNLAGFGTQRQKRTWELSQLINYGLEGQKLTESEVKNHWSELKPLLDKERARMLEYLIWKNLYSLNPSESFWGLSPKITS